MINFKTNLNIVSGNKKIFELKSLIKHLGYKVPLFIIDQNLKKSNKYLIKFLLSNKFSYVETYDYSFEPSYEYLDIKLKEYKKKNYSKKIDLVIGLGGGSTIDFAKGIALLLKNLDKKPISLKGFPVKYNTPIPILAIPSTCGTGSEVAFNASFIHEKTKTKLGINVKENFPVLSILDPYLIINSPKKVMYSGLSDTLVHIVEGYISTKSTNVSKYFSKLAFDLFQENVFKVIHGKANSKNYLNLQWASSFAMIGMSNSSHGISGALSYYLGTHYGVNHGIAGGFFLRKICKINHQKGDFILGSISSKNTGSKKIKSKEIIDFIERVINIFLKEFQFENLDSKLKKDMNFKTYISQINSAFTLNPLKVTYKNIIDKL
jgi:alcohol dehydrogenase class IV